MSQSPFDATVSSLDMDKPVTDSAAAPANPPAPRRRRHRSAGQRNGGHPAELPTSDETAAAQAAALPEAAAAPLTAPSAPEANGGEPAAKPPRARPAAERRGGRRGARTRAPQLIPTAGEQPLATESTPPAAPSAEAALPLVAPSDRAQPAEPLTPIADIAADMLVTAGEAPLTAPVAEPQGESEAETFQAHIQTMTAAEVSEALQHAVTEPATPTPRPRRYRFDRPSSAATMPPLRPERLRAAPEIAPPAPAAPAGEAAESTLMDLVAPSPTTATPPAEAEQTLASLAAMPSEAGESEAGGPEAGAAEGEEGQEIPAARRRRRRRRGNGTSIRHLEAVLGPEAAEAEPTPITTRLPGRSGGPTVPFEPPLSAFAAPPEETPGPAGEPYPAYGPDQPEPWSIASAYQQIRQPQSPFGAPEPSPARGFGPVPRGPAGAGAERPGRGLRGERATDTPPMSANQLGAMVTQAIQSQTDRLLAELRHTQAPPSMTVMFPPFPSTERVGVFVDVANLLYSARSMRLAIDFGRLLEFLRGNRRLVRAQAYAPTSPEPHAEQQFLSVVKGVGYRITTKNYKTFSSGAKKADLDLDLCMDIVRLIDARALDTIVLVSGDSDFLPLLEYCSDHGVRVEVAAFDDAAATILRQSCDLFINLSLVEEIRA
jgi:uncharacterized LabA/DUF88 family protein